MHAIAHEPDLSSRCAQLAFRSGKAAALGHSADRLDTAIAENGRSWLSNDEIYSIASAERAAGREMGLYFSSPNQDGAAQLRSDIENTQHRLKGSEEQTLSGLLEVEGLHFVAARTLITKHCAALAVLDSSHSPSWRYEVAACFPSDRSTALRWIVSDTQKDGSSCAVFAIAALRAISANPEPLDTYLRGVLPLAIESPRMNIAESESHSEASNPECTIVDGKALLPPAFYQYAHSIKSLGTYCAKSPYVRKDPHAGDKLFAFHNAHRRRLIVNSNPKTASFAIVDLQAQLLREAAAHEDRISQEN